MEEQKYSAPLIYPEQGDILLHKKGKYYKVLHTYVYHSELYNDSPEVEFDPNSIFIVYQALYGDKQVWARPARMFTVDRFTIAIRAEDLLI